MSTIDYDLLLKSNIFTKESLIKEISEFLSRDIKEDEIYLNNYSCEQVWDSDLAGGDYSYMQKISIALDKENAGMDVVAKVVGFYMHIASENKQEALIKSTVHDDICYISGGNKKWNNSFYSTYKKNFTHKFS